MSRICDNQVEMPNFSDFPARLAYEEHVQSLKGETVPHMRLLLALMFFSPILAFSLVQSGAESITPYLMALGVAVVLAEIVLIRRKPRA